MPYKNIELEQEKQDDVEVATTSEDDSVQEESSDSETKKLKSMYAFFIITAFLTIAIFLQVSSHYLAEFITGGYELGVIDAMDSAYQEMASIAMLHQEDNKELITEIAVSGWIIGEIANTTDFSESLKAIQNINYVFTGIFLTVLMLVSGMAGSFLAEVRLRRKYWQETDKFVGKIKEYAERKLKNIPEKTENSNTSL